MNVTFDWYCPHCGKRKDGGPDDYVIECMKGMKPLVYGLCKDCAIAHHRWMEGEEGLISQQNVSDAPGAGTQSSTATRSPWS